MPHCLEIKGMVEAMEWAEYIKFQWKKIVGKQESLDIVVYTDCKSLEMALKFAGSVKNRMLSPY